MKVRYNGKLYNTNKINTFLEQKNQYGYYGDLKSFIAKDGKKICFKHSKLTNFEHVAYIAEWDDEKRRYGSKELRSGVVLVEEHCGIQNDK